MAAERSQLDELRSALADELRAQPNLRWNLQGLRGGAAAYALTALVSELKRPILVLVASSERSERVAEGIRTVLGERRTSDFLSRRVHLLPAREAPPLEMVSPPSEVESGRSAALYQLAQTNAPIVVASIPAIAARTPHPEELFSHAPYLVVGDELERDEFIDQLLRLGYRRTGLVEEAGEFAVRGGILDIWPPGYELPCRCELFDDSIESIRSFDPAEQRSVEQIEDLIVLPARSFAFERLAEAAVRRRAHDRCSELLLPANERRRIDGNLAAGTAFPGAELLFPYVLGRSAWIGDYLPDGSMTVAVNPEEIASAIKQWSSSLEEARAAVLESGAFHPAVEDLYVAPDRQFALLDRRPLIELDETHALESGGTAGDRVWRLRSLGNETLQAARARARSQSGEQRLRPLIAELQRLRESGVVLVILASDATQLARVEHLLELCGLGRPRRIERLVDAAREPAGSLLLQQGTLEAGFRLADDTLAVVTDEDLFGRRRHRSRRARVSRARALSSLSEVQPGDFMVHVDHGIGLYRGLKHMVVGDTEGDFIHLEYAGGDRYYLPVDRINLVEKFTGAAHGGPPLSRLGSPAWTRAKKRVQESVLALAAELLDLEAFRAVHARQHYASVDADFEAFEAEFPFEETEGQQQAIGQIVSDLGSDKPMDRVVCGDVGYGKTEVALRAAYLTVNGGRQVAFLVPTTILAKQHYDTMVQRYADYPIRVAMLSRFNSRVENRQIVEHLASGGIDIVVGTHRLLQRDVTFSRLGLLVIDEEHRFGVRAKERIKKMRREVDVLTMTATPIPRTLQLALSGVRDLSLIETPPIDRLAIRTYVAGYDEGLIKRAIERELARGGQIFFVHHRVASIGPIARRVAELVPSARVVVGHGQMKEAELERVMVEFLMHQADVLVCTSIIESGLDIPNANTIIINRADSFGLAQLYQIRGRVGRSSRRAFAYLLVPNEQLITEDARRRLAVLQQLDDLGSGFRLAAHDMEIRGAGNLLGKEQSGHIATVGFDLFMRMMDEASHEVRGEPVTDSIEPEIELGAGAFLPDDYVDDIGERLLCYKRMASARSPAALEAMVEELVDRFGPMPQPAQDLVRIMGLRPILKKLSVESLKAGDGLVTFKLHPSSSVDPERLVELATGEPERYRLRPGGTMHVRMDRADWNAMVDEISEFLSLLEETATGG